MYQEQSSSLSYQRKFFYSAVLFMIGLMYFMFSSINNFLANSTSVSDVLNNNSDFKEETVVQGDLVGEVKDSIREIEFFLQKGDTLFKIIQQLDINKRQLGQLLFVTRDIGQGLKEGQKIKIILNNENNSIIEKIIIAYKDQNVVIENIDDKLVLNHVPIPFKKVLSKLSANINGNFHASVKKLGIPKSQIDKLVKAYNTQLNLKTKPNTKIDLIIEKYLNQDDNSFARYGNIIFASLIDEKNTIKLYNYKSAHNYIYFSESGKSIQSDSFILPVKNGRVTSRFGMRRDPINKNQRKMHNGIDLYAKMGTPVLASYDGVITKIGWLGGYGKMIQIQHSKDVSSIYAHLNGFNKNLSLGSRVKKGDYIGNAGKTGRATGPHVHYATIVNNKFVNPLSFYHPKIVLKGKDLSKFQKFKSYIHEVYTDLSVKHEVEV